MFGMRKSYIGILALLFSILSSITVSADSSDSTVITRPSSKWQLLFSTQGDLIPVSYINNLIGIQYSLASDKAVRLSFGLEYGDSSMNRIESYDTFGITQEREVNDSKLRIKFSSFYLYYIKYFRESKTIRPYYGGGPFFRYSISHLRRENSRSISDNRQSVSNSDSHDYSIGTILLVGAQYRISDHFQLHANYNLRLTYSRRKGSYHYESSNGDEVTEYMDKTKSYSFGIGSDRLNLGLSIGF